MRIGRVAALLTLACAANASAQDLMQAWRAGLSNDPQFAAARAAYRAGQEKLPQARAGLLPALSG
ncbi:hypothetical protein OMF51_11245, partial [Bordetella pertussis]